MAFVLASNNAGKLREFEQLFSKLGLEVLPQAQFGVEDADETGLSFIENALIKARHASEKTNKPAMADDSVLSFPRSMGLPESILRGIQVRAMQLTMTNYCRHSMALKAQVATRSMSPSSLWSNMPMILCLSSRRALARKNRRDACR